MNYLRGMDMNLTGKNALVCGSTQGIGKAAAIEIAQLGANVTLVARNEERLEAAMNELASDTGQEHRYVVADFSDPSSLKEALGAKANNIYHILINNTGGPPGGQIIDADIDEFRQAFNNHLICNHILAQHVVNGMKEAGYGRIVNIISTSVKIPLNGLGVSNTIRGGVASWAKTMANELGPFNITVNNVLPGFTNTVRLESIIENKAEKTGKSKDEVIAAMVNTVPQGRFAEANEVANLVAFFASPAASYINGVSVPVDGGRTGSI